ncbi:uncharacterized protein BKCO1_2500053 [Diplodia corticola]|uniref:Uncharacterized protein n=1 Tax=Diplodia corticola TaxID=236234 RepID=A0A1J9S0D6_9PEZI|nr:uncharacterized protein BKCO1_2500053 [Diplodia corticola]OJD34047.1 hypothetical protein BKCO1_2500053 [Diplodia corticola]
MVAILIILRYLHDQPLSKWALNSVSPNAVISILVTTGKTSMLLAVAAGIGQLKWRHFQHVRPLNELSIFDEATRGPWGALDFLYTMRARNGTATATLGAFVILLSLAMDPFSQQLITFYTRNVPQDGVAPWLATATAYDHSHTVVGTDNVGFQSAIVTALLGSPLPFTYVCTTGNCSWPDFDTLGICNTCRNVTADSTVEKFVLRAVDHSKDENGTDAVANVYTTPGGVLLNVSAPYQINTTDDSLPFLIDEGSLITGNVTEAAFNGALSWNGSIITFAVANTSRTPDASEPAGNGINGRKTLVYNPAADILECSIEWCAKSFRNVKVANGSLNDYTVSSVPLTPDAAHSTLDDTFSLNSTLAFTAAGIPDTAFTVAVTDSFDVQGYLGAFFSFRVDPSVDSGLSFNTGLSLLTRQNTSAAVAAVADALTLQLLVGPNSTHHQGTAYTAVVYVGVRWLWIILPATLCVLGGLFLGLSLRLAGRHRATFGWKSDVVPLMFHGLSGWGDLGVDDGREMDALAKGMRTRLARDEGGELKFVKVKEE